MDCPNENAPGFETPEVFANENPTDGAAAEVPVAVEAEEDGDEVGDDPNENRKGLAALVVDVGLGDEKEPKDPNGEGEGVVALFCCPNDVVEEEFVAAGPDEPKAKRGLADPVLFDSAA